MADPRHLWVSRRQPRALLVAPSSRITGHVGDLLHLGEAVPSPDRLAVLVDDERHLRTETGEAAVRVRRRRRNPRWDRRRASGGDHGRSGRHGESPPCLGGGHHAVRRARDIPASRGANRDSAGRRDRGGRQRTCSFSRSDRARVAASAGHLPHPDAHDRRFDGGRLADEQSRRAVRPGRGCEDRLFRPILRASQRGVASRPGRAHQLRLETVRHRYRCSSFR